MSGCVPESVSVSKFVFVTVSVSVPVSVFVFERGLLCVEARVSVSASVCVSVSLWVRGVCPQDRQKCRKSSDRGTCTYGVLHLGVISQAPWGSTWAKSSFTFS